MSVPLFWLFPMRITGRSELLVSIRMPIVKGYFALPNRPLSEIMCNFAPQISK